MVSIKDFKRLHYHLLKRGFEYKVKLLKVHTYTRFDITILIYQSPDLLHYKYIIIDTYTKWIIKTFYMERQEKYGYTLRNYITRLERKSI